MKAHSSCWLCQMLHSWLQKAQASPRSLPGKGPCHPPDLERGTLWAREQWVQQ